MEIDGGKVRAARHRLAWTQRELGARAGITFGTVCRIEKGLQSPHPTTVRKLAAVLGVNPEDLMQSTPSSHPLEEPASPTRTKGTQVTLDVQARASPLQCLSTVLS